MTTVYKYKKCNVFGFAQNVEAVLKRYPDNVHIYDNENETDITDIKKDIQESSDVIPTFVFDLESDIFKDIAIVTDDDDSKNSEISTGNYKHDDQELNRIITGQSTQLDAFSQNIYTVIYGKKTAGLSNGNNNQHIFNHNVIDSLAKNGVIVDPSVGEELSIHKIIRQLETLRKFNIFFVHSALDLEYTEYESPSEISQPTYTKGKGEICAVAYRALILRFFPYLTIITESMRENAYLF